MPQRMTDNIVPAQVSKVESQQIAEHSANPVNPPATSAPHLAPVV
jgi:hypothetical protein